MRVVAFLISIGLILKKLMLVDKVIFWVWDYYPIPKKSSYKKCFYRLYWLFDKLSVFKSDFVWCLSERILEVHKKFGLVNKKNKYIVVPLGIRPVKYPLHNSIKKNTLGFIGILKNKNGK